jgi:hypothetical protein
LSMGAWKQGSGEAGKRGRMEAWIEKLRRSLTFIAIGVHSQYIYPEGIKCE